MNKKTASMLLACMIALPALLPVTKPADAAPAVHQTTDIKVQINDKLVEFADAKPVVDDSSKLYVPVRTLTDQLGYQLKWEKDGSQIKVTIQNNDKQLSLTTYENKANINGKPAVIDSPAALLDNCVYVPFRLISETFGKTTQWDQTNRIAILGTDGNYYAPAWYRPTYTSPQYERVITAKATAYTADPSENGGYAGLDFLGNPLRVGTIAVDPNVIPLGTKVYIEGYSYDGLPAGGMYATATDTGSAIKGNKIDIFVPYGISDASRFGIQQVKVYILNA